MTERVPAEVFPPGEFVKDELEARGWSQADLAAVMDRPARLVSEIVAGKRAITPETARGLGAAFGTDPQMWLSLDNAYQLSRVKAPSDAVARRARLYSMLPIADMLKRHWIEPSDSVEVLEQRTMAFLGVTSLETVPPLAHAAKKPSYADVSPAQTAWLYRVRQLASEMVGPDYSEARLRNALPALRKLMVVPEDARGVPRVLGDLGIRYLVVESLPGAKIDGVAMWLGETPVIAMSCRYDRIDNFWFVLLHEVQHVLHRHALHVDSDLEGARAGVGDDLPADEREANAGAMELCIPKAKMDSWYARKYPYFSEKDLVGFARANHVHPGIAAGQFRHRTSNYRVFSKHLEKVRNAVLSAALVDGWGHLPALSAARKP